MDAFPAQVLHQVQKIPGEIYGGVAFVADFLDHTFTSSLDSLQNMCGLVAAVANFLMTSIKEALNSDFIPKGLKGRIKFLKIFLPTADNLRNLSWQIKNIAAACAGMECFKNFLKLFALPKKEERAVDRTDVLNTKLEQIQREMRSHSPQVKMQFSETERVKGVAHRSLKLVPVAQNLQGEIPDRLKDLEIEWIKTNALLEINQQEVIWEDKLERKAKRSSFYSVVLAVHRIGIQIVDTISDFCLPFQQLTEVIEVLAEYKVVKLCVSGVSLLGRVSFWTAVGLVVPSLFKTCLLWVRHYDDPEIKLQGRVKPLKGIDAYLYRMKLAGTPDAHPLLSIAKDVSSLALMFFAAYLSPLALAALILGNAVVKVARWLVKNPIEGKTGPAADQDPDIEADAQVI